MAERCKQAKADRAWKLTMSFLQKQGGFPWQAPKLKNLLCVSPSGSRRKQELDAVDRLLSGIEWVEEEFWVCLNQ